MNITDEKEKKPLVSVVMAAYNAEKFLEQAICSVIGQTLTDWELYVIDDHSSDATYAIAQKWQQKDSRVHALTNAQNQGVSRTRNRGIDLARGQYIAFLDADDVWYPEKLERQIGKFTDTNIGAVYCTYDIIGEDGQRVRPQYRVPKTVCYEQLLKENVMLCSAMVIPAHILRRYMFTTEFYHEDYVLALNILRSDYRAVGCEESLMAWRISGNSRSFNKRKAAKNRWIIYRKCLHLPLWKASAAFCAYVVAGVKKYYWGK